MRGSKVANTDHARRLRRNATIAEQRLWYRLRSRSLYGMKFVRQEPIGPYIVDFVCRKAGETFYEPPTAVHSTSRNPSTDKRAKILVFMISDQKNPSTVAE